MNDQTEQCCERTSNANYADKAVVAMLVAVVALLGSARAASAQNVSAIDRVVAGLRIGHIGLQAADVAQTSYLMGREQQRRSDGLPPQFREGNPVMVPLKDKPLGSALAKMGYAYALDWLIKRADVDRNGEHHHVRALIYWLAADAAQAVIVGRNQRNVRLVTSGNVGR